MHRLAFLLIFVAIGARATFGMSDEELLEAVQRSSDAAVAAEKDRHERRLEDARRVSEELHRRDVALANASQNAFASGLSQGAQEASRDLQLQGELSSARTSCALGGDATCNAALEVQCRQGLQRACEESRRNLEASVRLERARDDERAAGGPETAAKEPEQKGGLVLRTVDISERLAKEREAQARRNQEAERLNRLEEERARETKAKEAEQQRLQRERSNGDKPAVPRSKRI